MKPSVPDYIGCIECGMEFKLSPNQRTHFRQGKRDLFCCKAHSLIWAVENASKKRRETFEERFWAQKEIDEDGCWLWTGNTDRRGYGILSVPGKKYNQKAHRVAYELTHGDFQKDLLVCHECDKPGCINPKCLWLGTGMDNMVDRDRKGRHGRAKITIKQVHGIRSSTEDALILAKKYGISRTSVYAIRNGVVWKNI